SQAAKADGIQRISKGGVAAADQGAFDNGDLGREGVVTGQPLGAGADLEQVAVDAGDNSGVVGTRGAVATDAQDGVLNVHQGSGAAGEGADGVVKPRE